MNGMTRTESPVRKPERDGVVRRRPKVWRTNPASMKSPRSAPSRRSPVPARSRRKSQARARTSAAVAKRPARKTPVEATSSTTFTKWKVVPQRSVRTRSARSATAPLAPASARALVRLEAVVERDGRAPRAAHAEVQELDRERERHREVDVALLDVLPERLRDEQDADEEEEGEGEHLHRRVALDELADRPGEHEHHADREHHRCDHHRQVLGHPDSGDDRVEREDDVEDADLDDDEPEARASGASRRELRLVAHLELVVNLEGGLGEEEEPAAEQDEVAPGPAVAEEGEELAGEPHHPGDAEEEEEPRPEREREPEAARRRLRLARQLPGQDREEDDVVDAEDDLHRREGGERDPG